MKHFTCKWLKRFSVLIAIKLFIIAICLTLVRILFVSIQDYKEDLSTWLASEYDINISVANVSAGIDFSGLILTLNDVELVDSEALPFSLALDYLFLHLDLWRSVKEKTLNFNQISLQGVSLTVRQTAEGFKSEQDLSTLVALQRIFLQQLAQFSVKNSRVNFTDNLGNKKTVVIEKLHWLNKGNSHQGVGSASLLNGLDNNTLKFIIDLSAEPDKQDAPLQGALYVDADNLDISEYLIDHINPNAQIQNAVLGFQVWADFSAHTVKRVQLALKDSQLAWSHSNKRHDWKLNSGLLQLTNSEQGWLFDSYDLNIEHNQKKLSGIAFSGSGTHQHASFDVNALNLKSLLPFYLLMSELSESQVEKLTAFDVDAQIKQLAISQNSARKMQFEVVLTAFKNRPNGPVPGISHANIIIKGDASQGEVRVSLPKQKIYFDGQFSRAMPVESGLLALQWLDTPRGFKLFSEQSLLKTADLDTITEFSLLLPNKTAINQSAFLSLYSYASLNDASKAQYYYPVNALGENVFNYLRPTLKSGTVNGAKILWYGAFNQFPYKQHNGVFQAWVPLRDAQYDFYGQWQGATDLDLNLLFENDSLTMDALKGSLGAIKIQNLDAKIDQLTPNGQLTVNAAIVDDAQKISDYLKNSPLKESVGKALAVIEVENKLSGKLQITVPFNRRQQQTEILGKVSLLDNNINIRLAENLIMPLKKVQGQFSFVNGDLSAKNLTAQLFTQAVQISFDTTDKKTAYQINADIGGAWDLQSLSRAVPALSALQSSGLLDWSGKVNFDYFDTGDYHYTTRLHSVTQGVKISLPAPFNKNALQSWPAGVVLAGDNKSMQLNLNIEDKLAFAGQLNYQAEQPSIPYFALNIGPDSLTKIEPNKHIIKVKLDKLNMTPWYQLWRKLSGQASQGVQYPMASLFELDKLLVDINHGSIFEQPLTSLQVNIINEQKQWSATIDSDNLQADIEYRFGVPSRLDLDIKKLDFKEIDFSLSHGQQSSVSKQDRAPSENLLADYPEIFAKCTRCFYADFDFSPLELHLYPTKTRLNIDYLNIGADKEFTHISGVWDQRSTNMIVDSRADENQSLVKRLGFASPVVFQKAQLSGALNWIGPPWQFDLASLNGALSAQLDNGAITEVSDKGARLLSLFSLNGLRRSLNMEFNNVFVKGFNFNDLTLSAQITDGIIKNDDFYLNGSAGKILGSGLIDLPNKDTNYKFSYSPAVTSSLPVLTAFAINPLTGAAVLLMAEILEPVVEAIVRVDYSVTGALNDPKIELVDSKKDQVKLQNSELFEKINEGQLTSDYGKRNAF